MTTNTPGRACAVVVCRSIAQATAFCVGNRARWPGIVAAAQQRMAMAGSHSDDSLTMLYLMDSVCKAAPPFAHEAVGPALPALLGLCAGVGDGAATLGPLTPGPKVAKVLTGWTAKGFVTPPQVAKALAGAHAAAGQVRQGIKQAAAAAAVASAGPGAAAPLPATFRALYVCHATPYHTMPRHARTHATPCHAMPGHTPRHVTHDRWPSLLSNPTPPHIPPFHGRFVHHGRCGLCCA